MTSATRDSTRRTTGSLCELVVFAHGMANFGHNRGTKAEQERLLGSRVDPRHGFLGAFDDSGNYAFISSLGADSVREGVLAALNAKFDVTGVVVVSRASCVAVLEEVERGARERHGRRFDDAAYSVREPSGLWRLGFVFTDCDEQVPPVSRWPFDVLVKVANSRQLLSDGTARHCEGLRYTRNLIHAVRAAKDAKDEVTERRAETARATVRECHEDLENRLQGV